MTTFLLVHGGLWEDGMDAGRFWHEPGIVAGLTGRLLGGQTLRGLTDEELGRLTMPGGVLPSVPANPVHQRRTADALLRLLPQARELPGCPEPPRPEFPAHLDQFLAAAAGFAR